MGKDWDSFKQGRLKSYNKQPGGKIGSAASPGSGFSERMQALPPITNQRANTKCLNCDGFRWGHEPGHPKGGYKCVCDNSQFPIDHSTRETFIAFMTEVMSECLRVIKPGGHALVWALPRTSHWTGMALEDAGWQVRDVITHLFGSGFPKSLDIGRAIDAHLGKEHEREVVGKGINYDAKVKHGGTWTGGVYAQDKYTGSNGPVITAPATPEAAQWQGFGSALKPAVECWWLCRKPLSEKNIAANVLTWGCGGLNIDQCRISHNEPEKTTVRTAPRYNGVMNGGVVGAIHHTVASASPQGRFPSNLLLSHDPRCIARGTKRVRSHNPGNIEPQRKEHPVYGDYAHNGNGVGYADEHGLEEVPAFECVEGCPVRVLGEQSGESKSKAAPRGGTSPNPMSWGEKRKDGDKIAGHEDEGTAARYFQQFHDPLSSLEAPFHYFSKSSRRERSLGCENLPVGEPPASARSNPAPGRQNALGAPRNNHHPTVKPISLMRWLCRLITPPGGIVLDPFLGSGSTAVAAIQEGFSFIGIEQEQEYVNIARARIAHAQQEAKCSESAGQEWECVEECPIRVLGEQAGVSKSKRSRRGDLVDHRGNNYNQANGKRIATSDYERGHEDEGTVSRFFTQLAPDPLWPPAKPPTRKPKHPTPSPCTAVSLWDTGEEEEVS